MKTLLLSVALLSLSYSNVFSAELGTITPPPSMQVPIADTVAKFVNFAISIGAVTFLLIFIWGSLEWITSAGDKAHLEKAKARITTGAIGFIILACVFVIFNIVIGITYDPNP